MHPLPHLYRVDSNAGPDGAVVIESDGLPPLWTNVPPEFGGAGGQWSPETLFVAAVADCYVLTFRGIARAWTLPWMSVAVSVTGTLERPEQVTQFTRIEVRARLTLPPDADAARARRALERAEATCLITRSLKAETHLSLEIVQQAPVGRVLVSV
jgi:organic hydroperoxide reductase OsmC/OhrA